MNAEERPIQAESQPVIPLGYEMQQSKPAKVGGTLILLTLFICGASVGLFAIEADSRLHAYASSMHGDSWPAAIAVVALSAMGTGLGFFLTRRH